MKQEEWHEHKWGLWRRSYIFKDIEVRWCMEGICTEIERRPVTKGCTVPL